MDDQTPDSHDEPIPIMQQILDNPLLLLTIGVLSPTIFYLVWGMMDVLGTPVGN